MVTNILLEYYFASFTVFSAKFKPRYHNLNDDLDDFVKIGEAYSGNNHVFDLYMLLDEIRLFNGIDSLYTTSHPQSIQYGEETIYYFDKVQYMCLDSYNYLHILNF